MMKMTSQICMQGYITGLEIDIERKTKRRGDELMTLLTSL